MTVSHPNWISDSREGPVCLPSGADGANPGDDIHLLRTRVEAKARVTAGIAHGNADEIGRLLFAAGIGWIGGQIDGVVQRDHRSARRHIGQKGCGKVQIGGRDVLIIAIEGGIVADLAGRHRVLLAVDGPRQLRGRARQARNSAAAPLKLLHVAEAGGPFQQRAHRLSVALDLDFRGEDVAGVEMKRLDDVDAILGEMERESVGSRQRSGSGSLVERIIQLGGQRLFVGEERERQSEPLRSLHLDHVQRFAGGVEIMLQDPVQHLAAAIGKHDPIVGVLDRGFSFSCGGDGGAGGLSLRCGAAGEGCPEGACDSGEEVWVWVAGAGAVGLGLTKY